MTTIPPAYADKLRRLQELLPEAKLLDECPCLKLQSKARCCNCERRGTKPLHNVYGDCAYCDATDAVVPLLEVLCGRLVRAAVHLPGLYINDIEHTGDAYLVQVTCVTRPNVPQYDGEGSEPEYALLDAVLAALGEKV